MAAQPPIRRLSRTVFEGLALQYIHHFDQENVQAQGVKKVLVQRGIDTYDLIEALVEYPDGTLGRFTNCWILPQGMPIVYELKMRIVGSLQAIDVDTSDQEIHLITQDRLSHPITDWGNILGQWVGHPYTMLNSFMDCIASDTEPLVGHTDGCASCALMCG